MGLRIGVSAIKLDPGPELIAKGFPALPGWQWEANGGPPTGPSFAHL